MIIWGFQKPAQQMFIAPFEGRAKWAAPQRLAWAGLLEFRVPPEVVLADSDQVVLQTSCDNVDEMFPSFAPSMLAGDTRIPVGSEMRTSS